VPLSEIILIYPNPTNGMLTLEMEITEAQDFGLKLYNITGQEIWSEAPAKHLAGKYRKEIDMRKYSKGIYTLQLISEEGTVNRMIVVE
jgi:hypothetical protein